MLNRCTVQLSISKMSRKLRCSHPVRTCQSFVARCSSRQCLIHCRCHLQYFCTKSESVLRVSAVAGLTSVSLCEASALAWSTCPWLSQCRDNILPTILLVSRVPPALRVLSLCQRLPLQQKQGCRATLTSSREHLPVPLRVCSGHRQSSPLWQLKVDLARSCTIDFAGVRTALPPIRMTTWTSTSLSTYCMCVDVVGTSSCNIKGTWRCIITETPAILATH